MEINRYYTTIDVHTAGEPLRIITGGIPPIPGETMLEKRKYFLENFDHIRKLLMHEPRGHEGMYGCIITEPVTDHSDFGVLFMHNEGLSTMCGHGIIAVVTAVLELGLLPISKKEIWIDSPAGQIKAIAKLTNNQVSEVSFENVPSFVYEQNIPLQIDGKDIEAHISFGGAFYAIVDGKSLDVKVDISELPRLKRLASEIKSKLERNIPIVHPLEKDLKGIYGVIFSDEPTLETSHLRNVTVFADEQIDRSPCGTGTCAYVALLHKKNNWEIGSPFVHESIIGSQMTATLKERTTVQHYEAVIPVITGSAYITGFQQFIVDPSDPLKNGFLLK